MGIYDRDYSRPSYDSGRKVSFVLPNITPVVRALLIANVVVFVLEQLGMRQVIEKYFALTTGSPAEFIQVWRLVSYQFLHGGFLHILFNMIVLYFLGPFLERIWTSQKFLIFYIGCGIVGGIFFHILFFFVGYHGDLVGASGSIMGAIAAMAVLHPDMKVMLFFVLPMKLSTACWASIAYFVVSIFVGSNPGGNAAHIGGMLAGGAYALYSVGNFKLTIPQKKSSWEEKIKTDRELAAEVDRILLKVNQNGIASLTKKEKRALQEATKREQKRKF